MEFDFRCYDFNNNNGKYVMNCNTYEEAIDFCVAMYKNNRDWDCGASYIENNCWNIYRTSTCYDFNRGKFCDKKYYKSHGYIILKWSDFMNNFTKEDLKNGDIILRRNNSVEIVCVDTGTLITQGGGFNYLNDISKALNDKGGSDYDIVAVRRPKAPYDCCFNAFNQYSGKLVYERKNLEVVVEEMTLSEVCEALGKEIKIIKE